MKKLLLLLPAFLLLATPHFAATHKARLVVSEFIYEKAEFPSCHASTILNTREGLLAAWFGGTHENHPDVCIYLSSKTKGKWSVPVKVADGVINDTLRYACWNPVLFQLDNGEVALFYKVGLSPKLWWGEYKTSKDGGKSWSKAIKIPGGHLGPIKDKPVRLKDGTILCPSSTETKDFWHIHVETTDPSLQNWQQTEIDNNGFNAIQPTTLFYPDGRLQLLCRSREKRIVESWSADGGKSWSPLKATSLPNNNSGIDAVTLRSGLQVLICNPVEKGRNKLALLSSEDGIHWDLLMTLEDQAEGEFSYPAIIEGKKGELHITYTYNREKIKYLCVKVP
ncbi:MAG: exo-alpha-sialidase [Marinilabiliales bacterium]|nr:exo-alpha-sialidase [Marinilabiliales bacterium]